MFWGLGYYCCKSYTVIWKGDIQYRNSDIGWFNIENIDIRKRYDIAYPNYYSILFATRQHFKERKRKLNEEHMKVYTHVNNHKLLHFSIQILQFIRF